MNKKNVNFEFLGGLFALFGLLGPFGGPWGSFWPPFGPLPPPWATLLGSIDFRLGFPFFWGVPGSLRGSLLAPSGVENVSFTVVILMISIVDRFGAWVSFASPLPPPR